MRGDIERDVVEHGATAIAGMDASQGEHRLDRLDPSAGDLFTACRPMSPHLFGADAADIVKIGNRPQGRDRLAALRDGVGAPGLEGAATRAAAG